jgi:hypothetical protein
MHRERLSGRDTFICKFFFPPVLLLGAEALAVMVYVPQVLPDWVPRLPPLPWVPPVAEQPTPHLLFWGLVLCVLFMVWWYGIVIKRVETDWANLYISDYRREVAVSIAAVSDVRENLFFRMDPAAIVLDEDTPWGRVIRFSPPPLDSPEMWSRYSLFRTNFHPHPLLDELRTISRTARMGRGLVRIHQAANGLGRHTRR